MPTTVGELEVLECVDVDEIVVGELVGEPLLDDDFIGADEAPTGAVGTVFG